VKGHSLLEVLLTVGLLTVLMMAVLTVYVLGMRAWVKGDRQADRLAASQVACARLASDLQSSLYAGLEVGPHAFGCLSPRDAEGKVESSQADGLLRGQRFLVYWSAEGHLYRRELAAPAPLETSLADGQLVTRQPAELSVSQEGRLVTLQVSVDGHLSELTVRVRN